MSVEPHAFNFTCVVFVDHDNSMNYVAGTRWSNPNDVTTNLITVLGDSKSSPSMFAASRSCW